MSRSVPVSSAFEAALHEVVTTLRAPDEPSSALSPDDACACALCHLTARSVERWLRTFLAEYVNDPLARETLRRAYGFCPQHTHVLANLSDVLAIAILYEDLARLTRERWKQGTQSDSDTRFWNRWRPGSRPNREPSAPCPACVTQQEANTRYVRALAAGLDKPEVWEALEANREVCAAHVTQVMAYAHPLHAARLHVLESQRLAELQAELQEIIRKNDYRFRGEPWGEEKTAWRRALRKLGRGKG